MNCRLSISDFLIRPAGIPARASGPEHASIDNRQSAIDNRPVTIGLVTVSMRLPSRTLKEKRTIVKSVVERLRQRFNASVIEAGHLDSPELATLAATVLSNDSRHADEQCQAIVAAITHWRLDAEVYDVSVEMIDAG